MEKEFKLSEKKGEGFFEGRIRTEDIKEFIRRLKDKVLTWGATRNKYSSPKRREHWSTFDADDLDELNKEIDALAGDL